MRSFKRIAVVAAVLAFASPAFAASGKHNYIRNIFLNDLFRAAGTALPSSFEIRLYPTGTCPTATAAGTELSATGYTAITCTASTAGTACNASTSNWEAVTGGGGASTAGVIKNTNVLGSANWTAGENWTGAKAVQCVAITAGGAANVMYFGDLTSAPVNVSSGATATFAAGALSITEN